MEINEHKKSFQLERIILFSDAVFAIAITLLVIELKLPEMAEVNNRSLTEALMHTIPHFFSFFLSFMIIGIYWLAHHRMFNYVINYDNTLIWLNLFFLFFIALMPFSSNIYGVYSALNTAFILYVFNITMLALFLILMYSHISKAGKKLSVGLENPELVKYYKSRAAIVPICFLIGLIITLSFNTGWSVAVSRMSPILIFPAMRILRRKYSGVV